MEVFIRNDIYDTFLKSNHLIEGQFCVAAKYLKELIECGDIENVTGNKCIRCGVSVSKYSSFYMSSSISCFTNIHDFNLVYNRMRIVRLPFDSNYKCYIIINNSIRYSIVFVFIDNTDESKDVISISFVEGYKCFTGTREYKEVNIDEA